MKSLITRYRGMMSRVGQTGAGKDRQRMIPAVIMGSGGEAGRRRKGKEIMFFDDKHGWLMLLAARMLKRGPETPEAEVMDKAAWKDLFGCDGRVDRRMDADAFFRFPDEIESRNHF